jgi:integrase
MRGATVSPIYWRMMEDMTNLSGKHGKQTRHRGQGSVVESTDKFRVRRWRWQGSYVDETGTRRRPRTAGYPTKREAERAGTKLLRDLVELQESGVSLRAIDTTVADVVDSWLEGCKDRVRPLSLEAYELDAKLRIRPTLGAIRLHELTVEDVRAAVRSWGGPGAHTLVRLSSALRYAQAQGLVARNVAALVDAPAAAEKREVPTIGPDELRAIFDATAGTRLYPIVVLAGACGLRRGEILGLRAGDVDLDEAVLTVRGQYGRVPGQGARIRETKTASSVRAVAMPALAVEAVREYLAWRETQPAPIDGRIFAWHPNTLDRHFRDAMLAAGLGDIRLHDLRHGFATVLAAQGVHQRVAMAALGHAAEAMTHHYTGVLDASLRDAADRVDRALRRTS